MTFAHKWQPITDLADPQSLTDGELESLYKVWVKQKQELAGTGLLEEFDKKFRREWAIETGLIERVYTLDRGVTRTLIEQGIDAALIPHGASNLPSDKVARIIQDHYDTLEGVFDFVGGQRTLSTGYMRELHASLMRDQETYEVVDQFGTAFPKALEKGKYKDLPNNPTRPDGSVHEYCPPEHVASEMDRMIAMHESHAQLGVPPEVESAWLHHRFTQIHPFADGNGRVARAIASLVFIKAGWFPLLVLDADRVQYLDGLEEADRGDLRALVRLFGDGQRKAILLAVETAYDTRGVRSVDAVIQAIRDRLLLQRKISGSDWQALRNRAQELASFAKIRFESVVSKLRQELGSPAGFALRADLGASAGTLVFKGKFGPNWTKVLEVEAAEPSEFAILVRLTLRASPEEFFEITLAPSGSRRLVIASACFVAAGFLIDLPGGTFQINAEEEFTKMRARFSVWLEEVLVQGLKEWRTRL